MQLLNDLKEKTGKCFFFTLFVQHMDNIRQQSSVGILCAFIGHI